MTTPKKPPKKDAKRFIQSKAYFTSPFSAQWSPLPQEDMHFILKTVKDKLVSSGIQKKEDRVFRPWRKKKGVAPETPKVKSEGITETPKVKSERITETPKVKSERITETPKVKSERITETPKVKSERITETPKVKSEGITETPKVKSERITETPTNGWTDVSARRQLAIGINEVTRALERNEVQLVLVCKSVKPKHMTEHLVSLSASRAVPACQVPRLSFTVREPLGLKSVLALGFRRPLEGQTPLFTDVIEAIMPRVPAQRAAWLQSAAPAEASPDMEENGEKRGLKRKLEESNAEPSPQDVCTLLPLKVKKIMANPDKKRRKSKKL